MIDRDDYDKHSGSDPSERDELAAAGLHVVTSDDEDEDLEDVDPKAKDEDEADLAGDGEDEEELSEEEREKQEALADFLGEDDEI